MNISLMHRARGSFAGLSGLLGPCLRSVALIASVLMAPLAQAVTLADSPPFSSVSVPGNVIMPLSVEYPTANSRGYSSASAYSTATQYLGYFDPLKCYQYVVPTSGDAVTYSTLPASGLSSNNYFAPYGATNSSYACTSTSSVSLWSGNFLNWASMQALDGFRWALTGGDRAVDTAATTIVEKTFQSGQGGFGETADVTLSGSSTISGATPFNWSSISLRLVQAGTGMFFTGSNTGSNSGNLDDSSSCSGFPPYINYVGQNSQYNVSGNTATSCSGGSSSASGRASASNVYWVNIRALVCSVSSNYTLESNCVQYGSNYKPQGLLQNNAMNLRYSVFAYLNDSNIQRDTGVMRARMKYIGPMQPVPGSTSITNPAAEWSATTGVMVANPDSTDATNTTAASTAAGYTVTIAKSGVLNYVNKFGKLGTGTYKTYDDISELYYSAQRYFRNLGQVASYSSLANAGSLNTMKQWLDGFPVITSWDDPIAYSCQANFMLGIGDNNTHADANLPGSTIRSSNEPSVPSEVTADTSTKNVTTSTNMVGQLEGISNLGTTYVGACCGDGDTYFIAGMAYDGHVNDIRPDLVGTQTFSTFWVDVMEYQQYISKNQTWLAAKYGGFTVPNGFSPYASSNGTSTLPLSSWHTSTDTDPPSGVSETGESGSDSTPDPRPDNYYSGSQVGTMISGLSSAFSAIVSQAAAAYSGALATPSPNATPFGSTDYLTYYNPQNWTGDVIADTVTYDSAGNPTLTAQWDAQALLDSSIVTTVTPNTTSARKIVTCCLASATGGPSSPPGLVFEATSAGLLGSLNARTYYTSFANVPGVASGSQSAAHYVAYLRGDHSNEQANSGVYRNRTHLLGDIVDSVATPVGPPNQPYYDSTNPGYSSFVSTYLNRKTVVYVGANDGMMHAFDGTIPSGSTTCSSCGSELFAYIPSFLYGTSSTASTTGLASLGNPSFTHHYFVDATPLSFDVDFYNTTTSPSTTHDWHTLLIGGLGKGGTGFYAIDVTDPSTWTSESAVAGKVLWEFTNTNMGYSFGAPHVVKTKKYGWVVIFSSGYNNADGQAHFFIVDPKTGTLLQDIATTTGSTSAPLNVAQFALYIPDKTDFTADALYAGDLQGNVWRVDLTNLNSSNQYKAPMLLATLANASGTAQPVTTMPLIETDQQLSKRYLVIGTGQLLSSNDLTSSSVQSIYVIYDGTSAAGGFYTSSTLPTGFSFPIARANLTNDTSSLLTGVGSSPPNSLGYYVDLGVVSNVAGRVDVNPTVYDGVWAFAVNIPNGQVCSPGGTNYVVSANLSNGQTSLVGSTGSLIATGATSSGVSTNIQFQNVNGAIRLYSGSSTGTVSNVAVQFSSGSTLLRMNWREVPAAE